MSSGHILVAEELLGRHLLVGEFVHHINGVRGDNRPESLELGLAPSLRGSGSATPSAGRAGFTTGT
jgi:hypothetical protein